MAREVYGVVFADLEFEDGVFCWNPGLHVSSQNTQKPKKEEERSKHLTVACKRHIMSGSTSLYQILDKVV